MIITKVGPEHKEIIDALNRAQDDFKLDQTSKNIIDRIVFDGNIPVAYGVVKKLAEAIILVNPEVPILTRAKAMRELMKFAEYGTKQEGCSQLHCFVKDYNLSDSLVKHFGFIPTRDIVLVKNL